jgi:hypothetical protein
MKAPWKRGKVKHEEVGRTLDRHERDLMMYARRLRRLERELGLANLTDLKGANGHS